MIQRDGVRGGIDGDDAALDGKAALGRGRLLRLAAEDRTAAAIQQREECVCARRTSANSVVHAARVSVRVQRCASAGWLSGQSGRSRHIENGGEVVTVLIGPENDSARRIESEFDGSAGIAIERIWRRTWRGRSARSAHPCRTPCKAWCAEWRPGTTPESPITMPERSRRTVRSPLWPPRAL